ncbi:hypothetical protein Poli38472_008859 [Pythium oligandrum]|uniref:FYVE zinc finger domain-containing protein n=1 Tax=Pythium oligandrum TaxID=41045 RepID=A0A8K1C474_PYTOL|nr:hypothetical protein Poli38472_008859 [Pythium oligandrum]|eukprot:TMW56211.1 hypothetical protein Poli38472_008859 [Pythium oligandrum]
MATTHAATQDIDRATSSRYSDVLGDVCSDDIRFELWGSDGESSATFEYIRKHALQAIDRVNMVDPHTAYIPVRSKVPDVRLYKNASLNYNTPLERERCDFRGVTRVPGSLETVLDLLACEDDRESFWMTFNTQRGLLVNTLLGAQRLEKATPFPRWTQRYMVTRLSKHSGYPPVESCFAEYATIVEPDSNQDVVYENEDATLRRAFVYRRSMDDGVFNLDGVQDKLHQYTDKYERLFIQDWLYEISETMEPNVCKLVLSCSVYLTGPESLRPMRREFREFCAMSLVYLRKLLKSQWKEEMTTGVGRRQPWSRRIIARPSRCGVCSTGFTLLKRRHLCDSCGIMTCSRCYAKPDPTIGAALASTRGFRLQDAQQSRRGGKECILCTQFGSDGTLPRVSVNIRRQFTSSVSSTPSTVVTPLSATGAGEDMDFYSDDNDSLSSLRATNSQFTPTRSSMRYPAAPMPLSRAASREYNNHRIRSATEDNTRSHRQPEPEHPPADARYSSVRRPLKTRSESLNIQSTTRGSQGLVLLSDIEALSLTGSFTRVSGVHMGHCVPNSRRPSPDNNVCPDSPPMPSRRPARTVSEDNELAPRSPLPEVDRLTKPKPSAVKAETPQSNDDDDDFDDLANFTLKIL